MKAISLWQPWATLIAIGAKRIETRSWSTSYRGPLAIHAAKKWDGALKEITMSNPFNGELLKAGCTISSLPGLDAITLPLGKIVATCRLIGCERISAPNPDRAAGAGINRLNVPEPERSFGDYTPGRYAWILTDIQRLSNPIPWRGSQGFFDVLDDVVGAELPQNEADSFHFA